MKSNPKTSDIPKSVENLLKPRYKVLALWINAPLKIIVGDILKWDDLTNDFYCKGERFTKKDIESYPHLFKPLQWWEEREASEMPEYVKFVKTYMEFRKGEVYKTTPELKGDGGDGTKDFIYFLKDGSQPKKLIGNKIGVPGNFDQLMPATLVEYQEYLKSKK